MSDLVYRCTADGRHRITSPKPMTKCPAYHQGRPCPGELKQVGGGTGKPKSKRKETSAA